jgi:mannose-6-phosphate isomerase-like protein (cupin superfamily)
LTVAIRSGILSIIDDRLVTSEGEDVTVLHRIDEVQRPAWSGIGSAGNFRAEPETDFLPADDEHGFKWTMGRFDPHYHNTAEYWLISRGRGVIRIGDEDFDFKAGDIICIEAGKVHDIVGLYEAVEGFWFIPTESPGDAPHLYRNPEDAEGHVIPLLSGQGGSRNGGG